MAWSFLPHAGLETKTTFPTLTTYTLVLTASGEYVAPGRPGGARAGRAGEGGAGSAPWQRLLLAAAEGPGELAFLSLSAVLCHSVSAWGSPPLLEGSCWQDSIQMHSDEGPFHVLLVTYVAVVNCPLRSGFPSRVVFSVVSKSLSHVRDN